MWEITMCLNEGAGSSVSLSCFVHGEGVRVRCVKAAAWPKQYILK